MNEIISLDDFDRIPKSTQFDQETMKNYRPCTGCYFKNIDDCPSEICHDDIFVLRKEN